ncbi:MAG TPA: histidine kinase [Nannocystaceae bacterium]|nr:histidine kinase [Nannocystaceae bacterium]
MDDAFAVPAPSLLRSTLRALLVPRRLVPIVVIAVPLVIVQHRYSAEPMAGPVGAAMCIAFLLLGPVAWRALFPADVLGGRRTFAAPFGRLVVYVMLGAGTVALLGDVVPKWLGIGETLMTSDVSLLVSMALFWVGGYGLGRDIDLELGLADARARADASAHEAERSRLLALRAHLDPHFLFNTLNAIAEWCREDGEVAERATLRLSDMLRTILEASRLSAWPLADEITLCTHLFELHLVRDARAFALRSEIASDLPPVQVPPMILLPLCENAVKHGPAAGHRGTIELGARADEHGIELWVENPGSYAGPRVGGEGVELVRSRLAHAYAGRATLAIEARGERTRASMRLPKIERPEVEA